jgi:hypothetical protein
MGYIRTEMQSNARLAAMTSVPQTTRTVVHSQFAKGFQNCLIGLFHNLIPSIPWSLLIEMFLISHLHGNILPWWVLEVISETYSKNKLILKLEDTSWHEDEWSQFTEAREDCRLSLAIILYASCSVSNPSNDPMMILTMSGVASILTWMTLTHMKLLPGWSRSTKYKGICHIAQCPLKHNEIPNFIFGGLARDLKTSAVANVQVVFSQGCKICCPVSYINTDVIDYDAESCTWTRNCKRKVE